MLSMHVNNGAGVVTHRGLRGATIQPAVVMTTSECAISLLRCVEVSAFPGEGDPLAWYSVTAAPPIAIADSSPTSVFEFDAKLRQGRSRISSHGMTVFDKRLSNVRAVVELRCDKDEASNEGTAFGFTTWPITDRSYSAPNALMSAYAHRHCHHWRRSAHSASPHVAPRALAVRSYNGAVMAPPAKRGTPRGVPKIHPGDIVRFHVDLVTDNTVTLHINNETYGVVFKALSGVTLLPAVATYMTDRAASLLRCVVLRDGVPFPASAPAGVYLGLPKTKAGPTPLELRFRPDSARDGVRLSEENRVMASTDGSNTLAIADRGFSNERALVVFKLERDEATNQGTCFGFTFSASPPTRDYSNQTCGCFYRCVGARCACCAAPRSRPTLRTSQPSQRVQRPAVRPAAEPAASRRWHGRR